MPTVLQASMRSVPAGAVTFLPSTVSVTSAMRILRSGDDVIVRLKKFQLGFFNRSITQSPNDPIFLVREHGLLDSNLFIRARLAIQMIFKFFSEFFHEPDGRHRGRIAKRTKCPPEHVLGQVLH